MSSGSLSPSPEQGKVTAAEGTKVSRGAVGGGAAAAHGGGGDDELLIEVDAGDAIGWKGVARDRVMW